MSQRPERCDAKATDRATGRVVYCQRKKGHREQDHYWSRVEGDQRLSATWYGDGVTIGTRHDPPDETQQPTNQENQ